MKTKLGKKNNNYTQGIFTPKNKQKYKGTFPIIYRSKLELTAMRWFDNNPNIITWGSESIVIPYQSPLDGKLHRYFVDFVVLLKDKDGTNKKFIIEVKPFKQTIKPIPSERKKSSTIMYEQTQYIINQTKWKAAEAWANTKGYKFIILTEKHINN
jgi:hypothetical protein